MDGNTMAYWWTELLKATAGPASAVAVSLYVISRLFGVLDRLNDLVRDLAAPRKEAP